MTAVVDGGSIIVMSGGDNASAWGEFCTDDPLVITRSVTLEGRSTSGPRPTIPVRIGCPPDGTRSLLVHISGIDSGSVKAETINETRTPQNKTGSNFCRNGSAVQSSPFEPTDSVVQVRFLNVHLVKTVLSVSDASVQIDCSRLEDFRWKSVEASRFVELSVRESEATGRRGQGVFGQLFHLVDIRSSRTARSIVYFRFRVPPLSDRGGCQEADAGRCVRLFVYRVGLRKRKQVSERVGCGIEKRGAAESDPSVRDAVRRSDAQRSSAEYQEHRRGVTEDPGQ